MENQEKRRNQKDYYNTKECEHGGVYTDAISCETERNLRLNAKMRVSGQFFENLTWLTADEAAEYLRLPSVGMLRVLVCKREVPFHKFGRRLRFKRIDLDRLLEASRIGGI